MPRAASRITLDVVGVRAERLRYITDEDLMKEGAPPRHPSIDVESRKLGYRDFPQSWFAQKWDAIYANRGFGWDTNPWVFAYTFKVSEVLK